MLNMEPQNILIRNISFLVGCLALGIFAGFLLTRSEGLTEENCLLFQKQAALAKELNKGFQLPQGVAEKCVRQYGISVGAG